MVDRDEVIWFGRPPDESQLGNHDEVLAGQVRARQHAAYAILDEMVKCMEHMLDELRSWQPSSFGPADYQVCHVWLAMLSTFKNCAQQHICTEVDMIIKTYDAHVAFLLRRVKVIVATTDAANKLFANLCVGPAQ